MDSKCDAAHAAIISDAREGAGRGLPVGAPLQGKENVGGDGAKQDLVLC